MAMRAPPLPSCPPPPLLHDGRPAPVPAFSMRHSSRQARTHSLMLHQYDQSPRYGPAAPWDGAGRPSSQYQQPSVTRPPATHFCSMHAVNTPTIHTEEAGTAGSPQQKTSGVRNAINKASLGTDAILKRLRFGGSREKSLTIDEDQNGAQQQQSDLTTGSSSLNGGGPLLAPPQSAPPIQSTGWQAVSPHRPTFTRASSLNMQDGRPPAPHVVACHDCSSVAGLWGLNKRAHVLDPPRLGASGASQAHSPSEDDNGDARSNHMLHSCPAFRNELGGEPMRRVALCRANEPINQASTSTYHREVTASDAGVLENLSNVYLGGRLCASRQAQVMIEPIDPGAYFYRHCFSGRAHHNYVGTDEQLGPVVVSVVREQLAPAEAKEAALASNGIYRVIVRCGDQPTLRVSVLEEAVVESVESASAGLPKSGGKQHLPLRELLELVCPQLQISCLKLALPVPRTEELLINVDEQPIYTKYKIGILLCRAGQSTEEEMYNNEFSTPALDEFLDMLGKRVRLKGFTDYKGGLDTKGDTTGTHSVFSTIQQHAVMFHVSSLLPFTPSNKQQLSRKRHIGNDMVTIIFQEPDAAPFSALTVRSHFQHVFVVVRANNPCTEHVTYNVAVSRAKDVPPFGPIVPSNGTFAKSKEFRDFLLTKVINAENAVHRSVKFAAMSARTQREMLKGFVENNGTQHAAIEPSRLTARLLGGQGRSSRRSVGNTKVCVHECLRGALSWGNATVEDHSQNGVAVSVVVALSADTLVLLADDAQVLFATPTHSIIGWHSAHNKLCVFYEHSHVLTVRLADQNEVHLFVRRLAAVTKGCDAHELTIRPNSQGRHDFHIQEEGIVVDVSMYSSSWACGLRQGSRLVMLAGTPIVSLTPQQMHDTINSSSVLRALVIAPSADGTPRRGCEDSHCPAALGKPDKTRTPPTYNQVQAQRRGTIVQQRAATTCQDQGYETGTWTSTMTSSEQMLERRQTMPECSHQPVDTLSSSGSDEVSSSLSGTTGPSVRHTTLAEVKRSRANTRGDCAVSDTATRVRSEPDFNARVPPIPPRTYRGPAAGSTGPLPTRTIVNASLDDCGGGGSSLDRTHSMECVSAEPSDPAPKALLEWNHQVVEAAAKVLAGNPAQGSCQLRLQAALQRVRTLEAQVERLTIDLGNERTQRQDLESQVCVLREDCNRLKAERQRAETELQRFTSWVCSAAQVDMNQEPVAHL